MPTTASAIILENPEQQRLSEGVSESHRRSLPPYFSREKRNTTHCHRFIVCARETGVVLSMINVEKRGIGNNAPIAELVLAGVSFVTVSGSAWKAAAHGPDGKLSRSVATGVGWEQSAQ